MSAAWGRLGLVEPHSLGCPGGVRYIRRTGFVSRKRKEYEESGGRRIRITTSCLSRPLPSTYLETVQVRWQSNQYKRFNQLQFRHVAVAAAAASSPLLPENGDKPLVTSLQTSILKFSKLWKKFLPMCSLFFGMAFINTIVNSLALTLVVTSHGGGAQVLPYLTVYAALPSSLLFIVLYTYALQRMERRHVFTLIVSLFAVFNLLFGVFLYPNHEVLHFHGLAEKVLKVLPTGLSGAVGMARNWTFTLFYCMSELWGDVGLSLLFWGLANETTKLEDAAVLYPLFGFGANIAQMAAGMVLRAASSGEAGFMSSLQNLLFLLFGCKVVVIILHEIIMSKYAPGKHNSKDRNEKRAEQTSRVDGEMNNDALHYVNGRGQPTLRKQRRSPQSRNIDPNNQNSSILKPGKLNRVRDNSTLSVDNRDKKKKKDKPPSVKGAMRILSESPQIRSLGVITVSQCLAVNLMEFVWKSQLRLAYPSPAAFASFMGDVSTATGMVTCCLMLVSPVLFDRLSWGQVASLTPKLLYFGGITFFASGFGHQLFSRLGMLGVSQCLLPVAIFGGSALYVVARGVKFSLFKPAEEMVYITLDEESRTKGKAAIDVVGAQLGKSGGSLLQQVLLLVSGGALIGITPIIFGVYLVMLHSWQRGIDNLAATQMKKEEPTQQSPSNVANMQTVSKIPAHSTSTLDDDDKPPRYAEFKQFPADVY